MGGLACREGWLRATCLPIVCTMGEKGNPLPGLGGGEVDCRRDFLRLRRGCGIARIGGTKYNFAIAGN